MSTPEKNNSPRRSTNIFPEKDVLGQDNSGIPASTTKATPMKIFIIVGVIVAAAIVYWALSQR